MKKINGRAKGKSGERELIAELKKLLPGELTDGLERNLTQTRNGGHDVLGLDGWAIEVKRYAEFLPADMLNCWQQTVEQARKEQARPVLCYRGDRRQWRAVICVGELSAEWIGQDDYDNTVDMSLPLFAEIVRSLSNV